MNPLNLFNRLQRPNIRFEHKAQRPPDSTPLTATNVFTGFVAVLIVGGITY